MMQRTKGVVTAAPLFSLPPSPVRRVADDSACGNYRWTLTHMWDVGDHVCFCGLHPSFADGDDDRSTAQLIRLARAWGYSGLTLVNLYPLRSLTSTQCRAWAVRQPSAVNTPDRHPLQANLTVITNEAKAAALFVACWGDDTWDHRWVAHVLDPVRAAGASAQDVYCLGLSESGTPIEPMSVSREARDDDLRPQLWHAARP